VEPEHTFTRFGIGSSAPDEITLCLGNEQGYKARMVMGKEACRQLAKALAEAADYADECGL
jgi:hypothetical protein